MKDNVVLLTLRWIIHCTLYPFLPLSLSVRFLETPTYKDQGRPIRGRRSLRPTKKRKTEKRKRQQRRATNPLKETGRGENEVSVRMWRSTKEEDRQTWCCVEPERATWREKTARNKGVKESQRRRRGGAFDRTVKDWWREERDIWMVSTGTPRRFLCLQRWPPTSMTSSSRATYACAAASWGWVLFAYMHMFKRLLQFVSPPKEQKNSGTWRLILWVYLWCYTSPLVLC